MVVSCGEKREEEKKEEEKGEEVAALATWRRLRGRESDMERERERDKIMRPLIG